MVPVHWNVRRAITMKFVRAFYERITTIGGLSWLILVLTVVGILFKVLAIRLNCWGNFNPLKMVNLIKDCKRDIQKIHATAKYSDYNFKNFMFVIYNEMMSRENPDSKIHRALEGHEVAYNWARQFVGALRFDFNVGLILMIVGLVIFPRWTVIILITECLIYWLIKFGIYRSFFILVNVYRIYLSNIFFMKEMEAPEEGEISDDRVFAKEVDDFTDKHKDDVPSSKIVNLKLGYGGLSSDAYSAVWRNLWIKTDALQLLGVKRGLKYWFVSITGSELWLNILKGYFEFRARKLIGKYKDWMKGFKR